MTVLKDRPLGAATPVLPLAAGTRIYVRGVDPEVAGRYGTVVAAPGDADVAVLRISAPFEQRTQGFEGFFRAGRLDFTAEELRPILEVVEAVPTVVDVFLDRPAVIPEIADQSAALVADYGASDTALLDVLFGRVRAEGVFPSNWPGPWPPLSPAGRTCPTTRSIRSFPTATATASRFSPGRP